MSDKIRVGLVGTSHAHAAGKLAVLKQYPDFDVVGVCESDAVERAARNKDKLFANVRWVSEEALLSDSSVQLLAVEGWVRDNVAAARRAVQAGKHVHLDKPAGMNLSDFRALLAEAQSRNRLVQMGYMFRYNAGFQLLFRAAKEGWFGEIFFVRGRMGTTVDAAKRWALAEYPGGMMFELGCHLLDAVVTLLGPPKRATPFLRMDGRVLDGLADNTLAVFEFDHAMAAIESAAMEVEPFPHRSLAIYGTRGSFILEPLEPPAVQLCLGAPVAGFQKGWQPVTVENRPRYVADFADLAACIRMKSPLRFGPKHDLAVHEALLRSCGVKL